MLSDIHSIENEASIDALWQRLLVLLKSYEIDHVTYLTVDDGFNNPFRLSTLCHRHDENKPAENQFLTHRCKRYDITRSGQSFINENSFLTERSLRFVRLAATRGFQSGMAIPMRLEGSLRFGGFNLGTRFDRDTFLEEIWPHAETLRSLCLITHRRIEELRTQSDAPAPPPCCQVLTNRELEISKLLADGQSRKQVAHECNLSVHTVSDYAKSAYRKLGVRNRVELGKQLSSRNTTPAD